MRLTEREIQRRRALPPGCKEMFLRDDLTIGLGVRVSPDGTRAFIFEARFNGRPRRITLGRWPAMRLEEARLRATELRLQIMRQKEQANVGDR